MNNKMMQKAKTLSCILLLLCFGTTTYGFSWPWDNNSSASTASSSAATSLSSSSSSSSSTSNLSSSSTSRKNYEPYATTCPSGNLTRDADSISSEEADYIRNRHEVTNQKLIKFLSEKANLSNFDAESFISNYATSHNISIGLAFSGGGYRAMLNGAGQMLGLDDRFNESIDMGGLLQSATYLTGLSGGSWLVGSIILNDFISVEDILDKSVNIWDLSDSIINPSGINLLGTSKYYYDIESAISNKQDAGFDTSVTDVWGRALSYQFFDDGTGGVNKTWSGIRDLSSFKAYEMPFPIIVTDGRTPGTIIINSNSTVYEFNPYEMGSWDPSLSKFMNVKYLGTAFNSEGNLNSTDCIVNFDNAGFIIGTSSSLFNEVIIKLETSNINSVIKSIIVSILGKINYLSNDIAAYEPNPFFGSDNGYSESISSNETLFLVDGGEDQQNVPLHPLIQSSRSLDIIFAFDNTANTDSHWPNGTSLIYTYERQFFQQGYGTPFPYVPDADTFVNEGYNVNPVFFGCDAANLSDLVEYHSRDDINETDIPLVVYMPNTKYSYNSNTSTYQLSYNDEEMAKIIQNGFEVSTRGNLTRDAEWSTCVGCAIIRRSQERLKLEQSDECKKCFQKYCYFGNEAEAVQVSSTSQSTLVTSSTSGSPKKTSVHSSTATSKSKKASASSNGINGFLWLLLIFLNSC